MIGLEGDGARAQLMQAGEIRLADPARDGQDLRGTVLLHFRGVSTVSAAFVTFTKIVLYEAVTLKL